ncbi:uncharacterized protein BDW70DRAFT_147341 [Aspergillus foveolatus]|uniref:uncharacterized protein n=1 Tax=Aspergillus foveolatus TaxID=210207 RepID=UPI003CCD57E0
MTSAVTAPAPWIISSQQYTLQTCPLSLAHTSYLLNLGGNGFNVAVFASLFPSSLRLSRFKYMVCLNITPAFLSAANDVSFARIVAQSYSLIFVACDILFLLLQAAGGAITTCNDSSTVQVGINIMIAGLPSSLPGGSINCRSGLNGSSQPRRILPDSFNRVVLNPDSAGIRASKTWVAFLVFQGFATACIYSKRCSAHLANDETTIIGLEGAMISIAAIALSAWGHPDIGFQGRWSDLYYLLFSKARC